MALTPEEKKEINEIATRIRSGMPVTEAEDKRLDDLQERMYEDVKSEPVTTIYDLPVAKAMSEADARDMGE